MPSRKEIDHQKHDQGSPDTDHRVKAAAGLVKALKGAKKPFNRIRRRGDAATPNTRQQVCKFALRQRDPGLDTPFRGPLFQPRQPPSVPNIF